MTKEQTLGQYGDLGTHQAIEHVKALWGYISPTDRNRAILALLPDEIRRLPAYHAKKYLDSQLNRARFISSHLGPDSVERNGLTFSVETAGGHKLLVRLYQMIPVDSPDMQLKVEHILTGGDGGARRHMRGRAIQQVPTESLDLSYFFASAEVMTRTALHMATQGKRYEQPLPTVLLDNTDRPVGFALEFDRLSVSAQIAMLSVGEKIHRLDSSAGETAMSLYEDLVGINCIPYAEEPDDLQNMLLLDGADTFMTFARVGYAMRTFNDA
jgi:hypothetical protein